MRSASATEQKIAPPENDLVASRLEEIAQLLAGQGANPFRVNAYRTAAESVRQLVQPVGRILEDAGARGLMELPGIGRSIAGAIEQFFRSGKIALLQQLRGEHAPERIFTTVAGVGPKLAQRIHDELGLESLAELQAAAWDGRLARMPGMGAKRLQAIREALAGRSAQSDKRPSQQSPEPAEEPPVAELLDIDRMYRHYVDENRLPKISPRRFNPEGKAWLPIMHAQRGGRHYTALYSNTARAHEFGTTRDWVVIYRDDNSRDGTGGDGQWTVITSAFGKLRGKRIVRGREAECAEFYESNEPDL
jgi:putative hydrolase